MKILLKIFLIAGCICLQNVHAQGGGPPMITDDPGVVDLHKWEINTSVNSSITNTVQLAVPYIDANYGIARNLQLKAETPYLITFEKQSHVTGALGEVLLGLKFRFMDESKNFVSVGTYPQLAVTGEKGFLFPLLFEKTFGKFLVGEDIGNFFGFDDYDNVQLGSLVGYQPTKKIQVMGEYFLRKGYSKATGTDGFINFGFRYVLTNVFTLMGSFGSQVVTAPAEQRQYFISFLGVQSDF